MTPISVIIPVHNTGKYLSRCLDSIVNQTLRNLEIICINDGSEDDSAKILDEYKARDKRIVVINQENKGVGAARNAGLRAAHGEYVGFIDSDDWIDLDFFEKLYETARKYDADAVCSGIKRSYATGKVINKLKFEKKEVLLTWAEKYAKHDLPKQCYVWNKIYKKSELERQKLIFKEGVYFEDVYFSIRFMYFSHKVVVVPGVAYNYWVNTQSVTRTDSDKRNIDQLAARADFIKFSREHHIICNEAYYVRNKVFYKLFGLLILKIYEWETVKKYYLFGLIPFFEKRISL